LFGINGTVAYSYCKARAKGVAVCGFTRLCPETTVKEILNSELEAFGVRIRKWVTQLCTLE